MLKRIGFVIIALLAMASCGTPKPALEHPELSPFNKDQFDMYLDSKLTDKQREILSDYWVTDEEWIDISSDFHNCMEPTGVEGSLTEGQFGYGLSQEHQRKVNDKYDQDTEKVQAQFEKDFEVVTECVTKTADPIGLLYYEPRNNPDSIPLEEAMRRCLNEQGITDLDDIPSTELLDYVLSGTYNYQSTPERYQCITNPQYGEYAPHNN